MNAVFADTLYWYAVSNPRDRWHKPALEARSRLGDTLIVTTEEVLIEFLAAVSGGGQHLRRLGVGIVQTLFSDQSTQVIEQTHISFIKGVDLYSKRPDKGYSLVDCVSMSWMRDEGVTDVLTNDHHFTQEGFSVLIR